MASLRVLEVSLADGDPGVNPALRVLDITFTGTEAPKALTATVADGLSIRDTDSPLRIDTSAPLSDSLSLKDSANRTVADGSKHVAITLSDQLGLRDAAGGSPYQIDLLATEVVQLTDSVLVELSAGEQDHCAVKCRWVDALGFGLRGVVQFVPEIPFVSTDGSIVEAPVAVLLGRDGSVIVLLPKPAQPSLYPNGINWRCIPPSPVSPIAFTIDKSDNLITLSR